MFDTLPTASSYRDGASVVSLILKTRELTFDWMKSNTVGTLRSIKCHKQLLFLQKSVMFLNYLSPGVILNK